MTAKNLSKYRSLQILPLVAVAGLFTSCQTSRTLSFSSNKDLVGNVSQYDPKKDIESLQTPADEISMSGNSLAEIFNARELKERGVKAIIARATTGSGENKHYASHRIRDEDLRFAQFVKIADDAGLLIGAYHLLRPNEDPVLQADNFLKKIHEACAAGGINQKNVLIALDAGFSSVPGRVGQTRERVNEEEIVGFIKRIHQRTGVYPIYYPEGGSALPDIRSYSRESQALITQCPLWLPSYTFATPSEHVKISPWSDWTLHQFGGATDGRSIRGENPRKFYYRIASSEWAIRRNNKIVPLEVSRWNPVVKNPNTVWSSHSVNWAKIK